MSAVPVYNISKISETESQELYKPKVEELKMLLRTEQSYYITVRLNYIKLRGKIIKIKSEDEMKKEKKFTRYTSLFVIMLVIFSVILVKLFYLQVLNRK